MITLLLFLSTLFIEGNTSYNAGQYAEAAALYEQCLIDNPGPEVYYNLGNAYFKQNELGQAILAYERCLRLDPTHKDARFNLKFAQSKITDDISDNSSFFLSVGLTYVRNLLKESTWMLIAVISFLLFLVCGLFFAFGKTTTARKLNFSFALVAFVLSVCALANAGSLHSRDTQRAEAIITQGIVNAKAAPDNSGTDLFTLHEGTKVVITENLGTWVCIHVGNNIGWIQANNLERI